MRANWMAALGAAMMLAGCASVTRGTTEQLQLVSEPRGVVVTSTIVPRCGDQACPHAELDQRAIGPAQEGPTIGPSCTTPCMIIVNRYDELMLTFSLGGYEPQTVKAGRRLAAGGVVGVAGNAVVGGVTGLLIDTGTGAAYEHYPNPLKVILKPLPQARTKARRG